VKAGITLRTTEIKDDPKGKLAEDKEFLFRNNYDRAKTTGECGMFYIFG
jgi:hypothetical protein